MLTLIFGWILKFASSGLVGKVTDYLEKRCDTQAALHGQDTTAATQIVVAEMQAQIEARREQASFSGRHDWLVSFFAAPLVLHLWMIVLDSCFHLNWAIAALPKPFDEYEGKIILSFFIIVPAASLARNIASKIWK